MTELTRSTDLFNPQNNPDQVSVILEEVYRALVQKGYNPVNQIVGYIMSGDPTYITSYGGARNLISRVERDEILEELVRVYIRHMEECEK